MDPRYRRRATLTFGPNAKGGGDPVAMDEGRPVFWKGNPRDVPFGEPVDCLVSDAQYVSFALPAFAPPEEAPTESPGTDRRSPAAAGGGGEPSARIRRKTGLKREQLAAVKEAAEKRARKVAKEELKPMAAVASGLKPRLDELARNINGMGRREEESSREAAAARDAIAGLRKLFDDLASRVIVAESDLRALKAASRAPMGAIPKPVPLNLSSPTDEEIERQIVYQLHQLRCYGGKHASGEHFGSGYLGKVPEKRIRDAVKSLTGVGVLRKHPKTPPHYSLNADQRGRIAEILGVPGRDLQVGEAEDGVSEADLSRANGDEGVAGNDAYVERGTFENTIRGLRDRLDALERGQRGLHSATLTKADGRALEAHLGRLQTEIAELREAILAQATKIDSMHETIEAGGGQEADPRRADEDGSPNGTG